MSASGDVKSPPAGSGGGGGGGGAKGVITVTGDGTADCVDDIGTAARLSKPAGLAFGGADAMWITETGSFRVRRFSPKDGRLVTACGSARAYKNGAAKAAAFTIPFSVCADPIKPQSACFIGDYTSIRYFDGETVTLVCGGADNGFVDGKAENSRWNGVTGLVVTQNRQTLFATDYFKDRIRAIDLKSAHVATIGGDGKADTRDGNGVRSSFNQPRKGLQNWKSVWPNAIQNNSSQK